MRLLDSDIHQAKALVIDGNPGSRSALVAMLKEAGIGKVEQSAKVADARRLLESRPFDIVLCEYHFPGETMSGQDLIDDLRLAQLLPLNTVVVMISGEAAYSQVAEAAEAALDAYVIKPHTEQALRDRLAEARQRKRLLKPILDRVQAKQYQEAADLCLTLYETKGPGWIHAARIGAELMLNLGQAHTAMKMLEAVLATRALPWARMGIARTQYKVGSLNNARRTLESLLSEQPGYVDAYDVMGRVMLDQGDTGGAIEALHRASDLTPGSVARLQKFGVLAFYYGNQDEAAEALARATNIGVSSKAYDMQGLVLLAALQYDKRETRQLALSQATMKRVLREAPNSARLNRFAGVVDALHCLATRKVPEAVMQVRQMLGSVTEPQFDFEAACNLLMVATRLYAEETKLDDIEHSMDVLARRFAVSKTTCEMLVSAARHQPELAGPIRLGYAHISALAESAVSLSVAGKPQAAVMDLLSQAEQTLNSKLLDLAAHTLERHRAAIPDAPRVQERIDALRSRYHSYGTQVRLTRPGEHDG
ncbi:response regulator [Ideonella sp. BN130291]|uniref:response regulator n=1 Tax=Ideonella sp. BN130291 TaxID=3112940 RepID=UPI002E25B278|nr:response regulator [Ideonella sp. BN130291]